jgi:hypothetical protein
MTLVVSNQFEKSPFDENDPFDFHSACGTCCVAPRSPRDSWQPHIQGLRYWLFVESRFAYRVYALFRRGRNHVLLATFEHSCQQRNFYRSDFGGHSLACLQGSCGRQQSVDRGCQGRLDRTGTIRVGPQGPAYFCARKEQMQTYKSPIGMSSLSIRVLIRVARPSGEAWVFMHSCFS